MDSTPARIVVARRRHVGTYTVIDGGGSDSRTLRGHGRFEALAGIGGAYQGQAHCD
jgi:hypothetical protein